MTIVLFLDIDWQPLRVEPWTRAVTDLFLGKVEVIEYSRDRQQPTRLCGILCPFGKPPHLPGRKVQPHRYRLTHGKRSSGCHLESLGRRFRNPSKSQSLSRLVSGDLYADLRSDRFNSPRA